ncbi:MAG TPA: HD domain-containing phosphohydrolase [Solirubrobacteraceae bacterium]|nr:HD domain-containing phosphohydrolase [Solirubrobacteraceae bacterium]
MQEAKQTARTVGTRRVALLLLGIATIGLVPAFFFLSPTLHLAHPGLLAMLFAFGICAYRVDVRLKIKVPLKIDGGAAMALVAVALSGPLAGLIVLLPWEIASRLIWREHKVFTPGALANVASYGWCVLAAGEILKLADATTLAPRAATGLFTAGIVMGVVQFAVARLFYGTLYQGFRPWSLLRSEFPNALSVLLVDVLLGTITAVLFGAVGIPAFVIFALVILVPSLVLPALATRHSVTQLDPGAAAALYATALGDVLQLSRHRRRVLAGAAHLAHHGKHAPNARWDDLHSIEFAARYAGECYDGAGKPAALAATHIPLDSRILAVARRWAELTAAGSQQLPHAEALLGLELAAGSELDPHVVAAAGEIVNAELPFARDNAFQPVLHRLPLPRVLRREGLPQALAGIEQA